MQHFAFSKRYAAGSPVCSRRKEIYEPEGKLVGLSNTQDGEGNICLHKKSIKIMNPFIVLLIVISLLPAHGWGQDVSHTKREKLGIPKPIELASALIAIALLLAPAKSQGKGVIGEKREAAKDITIFTKDRLLATIANEKSAPQLQHFENLALKECVLEKEQAEIQQLTNSETQERTHKKALQQFVKRIIKISFTFISSYICFRIVNSKIYPEHITHFDIFISLFGVLRWTGVIKSKTEVEATIEKLIWVIIKMLVTILNLFSKKN